MALLFSSGRGIAQDAAPEGPVYIVQEGDTLWSIAQRFGVSVDELARYNGIADPSQLFVGARLVIPGLEGVSGVLTTVQVDYGETLRSLSRRYHIPEGMLARLNRLVSPDELYAGADLIVTQQEGETTPGGRTSLSPGMSLLEIAVLNHANPWFLVAANSLQGTWDMMPGDVLRIPGGSDPGPGALPLPISAAEITPLPTVQGKTVVIQVMTPINLSLGGNFVGHELHFFELEPGQWIALQGIHAMTPPGFYPLSLAGSLPDGAQFEFTQSVYVADGGYLYDPPLTVDPATIDPAVTQPEDEQWSALAAPVSSERYWSGMFVNPSSIPLSAGFPSVFGSRRSYNGGAYDRFHTGLDMYGGTGSDIYAAADGVVVFAGPLTVRGNAIMIDHGWGVYTGFMHLSELKVGVGDRVTAGQLIGLAGGTGRVSGPHLHFEVWVGGVQVDPLEWLEKEYP